MSIIRICYLELFFLLWLGKYSRLTLCATNDVSELNTTRTSPLIATRFSALRVRIYFDITGSGKVITLFYCLIFISSMSRAIWFLIPSSLLEVSYAPVAITAWADRGWIGMLASEILAAIGSLSLYSVFILVTCYWSTMMRKVNIEVLEPHGVVRPQPRGIGAIKLFFRITCAVGSIQLLGIILFLSEVLNSEGMILFDSITLSIIAVVTSGFMTVLSTRIRVVLMTIGAINSNSTKPQTNRILAMTRVGNVFFSIRVAVELAFTVSCITLMRGASTFS